MYESEHILIERAKHGALEEINKNQSIQDVVLYHYTSAAGLLGIIDSGCIWGTHCDFLNDPQEVIYSETVIKRALYDYIKDDSFLLENKILTAGDEDSLFLTIPYEFYISSFSEEKDLLSQWRGYGDDGQGYSIGFCPSEIENLLSGLPYELENKNSNKFRLIKLVYDYNEQISIVKLAIKQYLDKINEIDIGNPVLKNKCRFEFLFLLKILSMLLKIDAYKEEKEWRIVRLVPAVGHHTMINYREFRHILIPYFKFPFVDPQIKKLPIKKIVCGPKQDVKKSKKVLYKLFESRGYSSPYPFITDSRIPYV